MNHWIKMNQNKFTKLTLEQPDKKITWEIPHDDISASELCEALYSLMIGFTFAPQTVITGMKNFLAENDFSEEN